MISTVLERRSEKKESIIHFSHIGEIEERRIEENPKKRAFY